MGLSGQRDRILVQIDIINVRMGSVFGLNRLNRMGIFQNRHFRLRIEKISEDPCPGWAGLHAGRFEPSIDPVRAEGALLNDLLERMHIPHSVRAGHHTIATANARMGIDNDNAIFSLERGFGRTNGNTTRIVTVIAENRQERFPHIGIKSFFDLLNP